LATDYKVRLSAQHYAYIAKTSLVRQNRVSNRSFPHNPHLSGNIKVFGEHGFRLCCRQPGRPVSLSRRAIAGPLAGDGRYFRSDQQYQLDQPAAFCREIRNTWYEQVEDDVLRVYIQLKHTQHWGSHLSYDSTGRKLVIRIRRQPAALDIRKLRIAIDAGHGGDNSGAAGVTSKILEKNYTLLIAEQSVKRWSRIYTVSRWPSSGGLCTVRVVFFQMRSAAGAYQRSRAARSCNIRVSALYGAALRSAKYNSFPVFYS